MRALAAGLALLALAACGGDPAADENAPTEELALNGESETADQGAEDVSENGPLAVSSEGATPMAERVAVLGLLNKRNGISREVRLRPGESARIGDVLIRLRACETTAPWEPQRLTGAFVQLFVRENRRGDREGRWQRVFSGWLFKERPALNVVEHRLYDVWPKACEMTYPGSEPPSGSSENARSSAPREAPAESAPPPSDDSAESSNPE